MPMALIRGNPGAHRPVHQATGHTQYGPHAWTRHTLRTSSCIHSTHKDWRQHDFLMTQGPVCSSETLTLTHHKHLVSHILIFLGNVCILIIQHQFTTVSWPLACVLDPDYPLTRKLLHRDQTWRDLCSDRTRLQQSVSWLHKHLVFVKCTHFLEQNVMLHKKGKDKWQSPLHGWHQIWN